MHKSETVDLFSLYSLNNHPPCRFSKLFISHLDAEFKKQASPAIKTLIMDQVSAISTILQRVVSDNSPVSRQPSLWDHLPCMQKSI